MDRVVRALTKREFDNLTATDIWAWYLVGWVFGTLPADHPLRRELMLEYTRHQARYVLLRSSLHELQAAWDAAGIRYYALKGIAFQHVYDDPRMRFHGDIDLYVPPAYFVAALRNLPPGWSFSPARPLSPATLQHPTPEEFWFLGASNHNAGVLKDSRGQIIIDLHHRILPASGLSATRSQKIHTALEQNAILLQLTDAPPLPAFSWTDQVLVGMVINRCWLGDHWCPKASDYPDLENLLKRGLTSTPELEGRAYELGLTHTLRKFLSICNPQTGTLALHRTAHKRERMPSRADLHSLRDGYLHHTFTAPLRGLSLLRDMLMMGPVMLDLLRALRKYKTPPEVISKLRRFRGRSWTTYRYARTVRWQTRLLRKTRLTDSGACVLESLALLAALRNDGIETTWVHGFRTSDHNGLPGHAWVEWNNTPLAHEKDPRENYRVIQKVTSEGIILSGNSAVKADNNGRSTKQD